MVNTQLRLTVHWKGRVPLEYVSWRCYPNKEVLLQPRLEAKREDIWKKALLEHPSAYDGSLLVLDELQVSSTGVHLDLSTIRFSRVVTLDSLGLGLSGYGCLGCQIILLSPDRQSILIGERAGDSMYCPLFLSVPGGMLEAKDAEGPLEKACSRELTEEAAVGVTSEKHLLAVLGELHGRLGVILLIEMIAQEKPVLGMPVHGNEEWTHSQLSWYPVDELDGLDLSQTLEGVFFAADERCIYRETGSSILWP
ncbi:MAG: hypothetical protein C4K49_09470 [Candidatus Thorarchaeota archaeon]|nr:MAG: hypothetical protein C4K49_09470 [Candidatus Thorarchaeota archaeon]